LLTPGISCGYWKARKRPARLRVDREVQAFENFAAGDLSVEVFDFEGHESGENDE
jgi:hypothetical protein